MIYKLKKVQWSWLQVVEAGTYICPLPARVVDLPTDCHVLYKSILYSVYRMLDSVQISVKGCQIPGENLKEEQNNVEKPEN